MLIFLQISCLNIFCKHSKKIATIAVATKRKKYATMIKCSQKMDSNRNNINNRDIRIIKFKINTPKYRINLYLFAYKGAKRCISR